MPSAETNEWKIIHSYQNLVLEGKAKAITCIQCEIELIPRIGKDGIDAGPILWCPSCNANIKPGIAMLSQITNIVKEHYILGE